MAALCLSLWANKRLSLQIMIVGVVDDEFRIAGLVVRRPLRERQALDRTWLFSKFFQQVGLYLLFNNC